MYAFFDFCFCVCVCVCVCIYIYIFPSRLHEVIRNAKYTQCRCVFCEYYVSYLCVYAVPGLICNDLYMQFHTYVNFFNAYVCTHIHACTHTYIHTYIHTRILSRGYKNLTRFCLHAKTHTHTHTYIHTYIHTHTHIYIHTHTHICRWSGHQCNGHTC
jgi:hypothetical protein